MKYTLLVALLSMSLLLAAMIVLGQEPGEPYGQEYWDDPSYVNTIDWSTYNNWENVDWDSIDWNTVNFNAMAYEDISTIAEHNPTILDNGAFFQQFDTRMQTFSPDEFSSFGADHQLFSQWANKKGFFVDVGAGIARYDGTAVTTTGPKSVQFTIAEFPGSRVAQDGSLVLPDGTKISFRPTKANEQPTLFNPAVLSASGGKLSVRNGAITNFQGKGITISPLRGQAIEWQIQGDRVVVTNGNIFLPEEVVDIKMKVEHGSIWYRDYTYKVPVRRSMTITSTRQELEVQGDQVLVSSPFEDFTFSGTVVQRRAEQKDSIYLMPGSSYQEYLVTPSDHAQGQLNYLFKLTSRKEKEGGREIEIGALYCKSGTNCIRRNGNQVMLSLKENMIKMDIPSSSSLNEIFIFPVGEKSELIISGGESAVRITKGSQIQTQGDLHLLRPSTLIVQKSPDEFTLLEKGTIRSCPECRPTGVRSGGPLVLTHIAADRLDGQRASLSATTELQVGSVGWTPQDIESTVKQNDFQQDVEESSILMISGHHYGAGQEDHGRNIIFGTLGEIDLNGLPPSNKVEVVAFSSCSTSRDYVMDTLRAKYPHLKAVVTWEGHAPADDGWLWENVVPDLHQAVATGDYAEVKSLATERGDVGSQYGKRWHLSTYVKERDRWKKCSPVTRMCG